MIKTTFTHSLSKRFRDKNTQNKLFVSLFFIVGLIIYLGSLKSEATNNASQRSPAPPPSADTYIPLGYTLVPIEIVNSQQISSLIGNIGGQVDLYSTNTEGRRSKKIQENIKLLRAPLDPDNFAVLIQEEKVHSLLSNDNRFFAVILNPNKPTKRKKVSNHKSNFEIEYHKED